MRSSLLRSVPALSLALAASACSSSSVAPPEGPTSFSEAKSSLKRVSDPSVADADRALFISDNSAFAVDLMRVVAAAGENTLVSPHSISTALAMTYAGAAAKTRDDIGHALHFTLPEDKLHPAFNWIDLELSKRAEGAKGKDGKAARLNVDNLLFGAPDAEFATPYLDALALHYGAGVKLLDFQKKPTESTKQINDYVDTKTEGRIKDLLSDPLSADTRFVLVNTVYANAAWAKPFAESQTVSETFHAFGGDRQVPMMKSSGELSYASNDKAEVVELPLDGGGLVFDVVLPKGTVAEYQTTLTGGGIDQLLNAASGRVVKLSLPKFRLEPKKSASLKEALSTLGMASAFAGADFSRMLPKESIVLADVVHKTFLEIDEKGLEAAAATAVIGEKTSAAVDPPVTVTVDRPFVIVLRDRPTGQILFLGQVNDPT
jgi:serpin B